MSRKGNCWDNAPTERFFRSLNTRPYGKSNATRGLRFRRNCRRRRLNHSIRQFPPGEKRFQVSQHFLAHGGAGGNGGAAQVR